MYRVFLSYNTSPEEMVVVWRLQTLAAASGLHLDVPNHDQRLDSVTVREMIERSDCVLALLTKRATKQVQNEIQTALDLGKKVIPIVEPGYLTPPVKALLEKSGNKIFVLHPARPWEMEQQLSTFLRTEKFNKNASTAILALAGTVVGLLLLQELTKT